MDNASKALIIAGAVLIAVMLVSVGVMIYQQASGIIGTSSDNINTLEISLVNNLYNQYVGNNRNRTQVAQLLETAAQQHEVNAEHTVKVTISGDAVGLGSSASPLFAGTQLTTNDNMRKAANAVRVQQNKRYDITTKTDTNGYINEVIIKVK